MSHTLRRYLLSVLVGALVALLLAVSTAGAEVYGLGDAPGQFAYCGNPGADCCYADSDSCPAGTVTGYWDNPLFKALTTVASAHRVTEVRLFVAYDAVDQFDGSTSDPGCTISRVLHESWTDGGQRLHPAGQSWQNLLAGLEQAYADDLTPVVSIAGYSSPAAVPPWDQSAPDPTTLAGYWAYRCGVQGILGAITRLPAAEQPHIWEALNEPEALAVFRDQAPAPAPTTTSTAVAPAPSCAVGGASTLDGPAKAACEYAIADQEIRGFAGHADDTVLAGALSRPSPTYLAPYVAQLASALPGTEFPASWAVHDYGDVGRSYDGPVTAPLAAFDQALQTDTGGRAQDLWVTESGMVLTSTAPVTGCAQTPTNPGGTLGACLSGQPARQAADAAGFFALPSAGTAVPITHLFWYQWQGEPNWDSGLTDAAGRPRVAWCAFYGTGTCTGSPTTA